MVCSSGSVSGNTLLAYSSETATAFLSPMKDQSPRTRPMLKKLQNAESTCISMYSSASSLNLRKVFSVIPIASVKDVIARFPIGIMCCERPCPNSPYNVQILSASLWKRSNDFSYLSHTDDRQRQTNPATRPMTLTRFCNAYLRILRKVINR